jgi:DSF synthase
VLASDAEVFNLGGDLALFAQLIRSGNRGRLLEYAKLCVEVAFNFSRLYEDRVHSIAVVQGEALGGGFEAALCCHTIIAEEGVGMGFPEVLFDLFPGMGAYTFLTRRVTPAQAERMMLDARIYPAEELLKMGVVDYVVPRGEGQQAARDLIRRHQRISNALRSMNVVRQACRPVSLEELLAVTSEWVEAAMRLNERALKTMERLIRAQQKRADAPQAARVESVDEFLDRVAETSTTRGVHAPSGPGARSGLAGLAFANLPRRITSRRVCSAVVVNCVASSLNSFPCSRTNT